VLAFLLRDYKREAFCSNSKEKRCGALWASQAFILAIVIVVRCVWVMT